MEGRYEREYEKIWSVPGGCTVLEKMENENYGGIWRTHKKLSNTPEPGFSYLACSFTILVCVCSLRVVLQ